jgi:uncharacterized protein (TIGR03790 family)
MMSLLCRHHLPWLAVLLLGCVALPAQPPTATRATAVVYNSAAPGSEELAKFYAAARGIPERQIIGLHLPVGQEISRQDFQARLADPLAVKLEMLGLAQYRESSAGRQRQISGLRIRYLVLMRGMPLRIGRIPETPEPPPPTGPKDMFIGRNEASVDSELSCLLVKMRSWEGPVDNPYFKSHLSILEAYNLPPILLVCRLDAPQDATVKRMIQDGLATEKEGRLWGRAWVDSRGLRGPGFGQGDDFMRGGREALAREGIPVIFDEREAMFPPGYPVSDCAFYLGWYAWNASPPWTDPGFRFHPGAVAVHLHSFSAERLDNGNDRWVGPFLERGAAASLGNVFEPYLPLTTYLDIFTERLLQGHTFGEAFYMAQPVLSWMAVAVGDPLYTPFPMKLEPGAEGTDRVYAQVREVDRASRQDPPDLTQWAAAAQAAQGRDAGILWECLALRQSRQADTWSAALVSLGNARKAYPDAPDRARCLILESQVLVGSGQKKTAIELLQSAAIDANFEGNAPAFQFYLSELLPAAP